jgi:histidine triad (HIT) family protein
MRQDCIFCRIAAGDQPASVVYKDDKVVAFNDIHPVAPTHVLIVPREHVEALSDGGPEREQLLGRLLRVAPEVAKKAGVLDSGYRVAINQGRDAGQDVPHLHVHVIGGKGLGRIA